MKRFLILSKTELKLSLRSFDAVFFALLMPAAIVCIIGLIYKGNSEMIQKGFAAWITTGICAIGLMGLPLVLADYREKKILKRFQVTPVSPALLLGVQFGVQALMAVFSALLVALAAAGLFHFRLEGSLGALTAGWFLVMAAIFSLGLAVASVAPDMKKAGIICSVLYFPMLLFSGTTIPFSVFPEKIQKIASFLPLTRGITLLSGIAEGGSFSDFIPEVLIMAGTLITGVLLSLRFFQWDMKR